MDYTLMPAEHPCLFTSMGMFIIDENRYPEKWARAPDTNVIGGALTYAVVGARMVAGAQLGGSVAGIVDKGSDFPQEVEDTIRGWQSGLIFRTDQSRLTSRGVNDYQESGIRDFYYETPKKRIEVVDILSYDRLLHSRSFHLICSIERCESIIDTIVANRGGADRPLFIWEPLPDDCRPENYSSLCKLLPKVDIFTPNLIEAQNFIERTDTELPTAAAIESFVDTHFASHLTNPASGSVIRCGERGCYIRTATISTTLPAYHDDQRLVVDPTGGGNSFCGGFMTGYLLSNRDWIAGGICGNLVSGCIIERLGPPVLTGGQEPHELWNGKSMKARLAEYKQKYPGIVGTDRIGWL